MARKRSSKVVGTVTHRFDHPDVLRFTRSVLGTWHPSGRPVLFVPCAKKKPIQESASHKQMFRRFREVCDMLIVSEPMTVIPYERTDYPAYEYPPYALWKIKGESEKFISRLSIFLGKNNLDKHMCRFLLPHHHMLILWKAWERAFGDIKSLDGYAYSQATRWFFVEKLCQSLGALR